MKIAHLHVWDQQNKGDAAIVAAVQELLLKKFPGCKITDYPVDLLKSGRSADADQINQSDIVVIGGGGILYSYFLPFNPKFIRQIKIPIVIFGVGYIQEIGAADLDQSQWESIKFLLQQASLISVRENNTFRLLNNLGINKEISVIGDPAVLLSEKPTNMINLDFPVKIGLNLNYSGWMGFGHYRRNILSTYQTIIDHFKYEHQAAFFYLQHHPGEDNIYPELGCPEMQLVNIDYHSQKWVYGQLDLVVGMMLHSVVKTFGAGTPFISIGYDIRCQSFADFIGYPDLNLPANELTPDQGLNLAKNVFSRRKTIRRRFKAIQNDIAHRHDQYLEQISSLIDNQKLLIT